MSRKHAELEREFIDDLPSRTGRSLEDWMSAIRAAGLSEKNAIIDWLRPQGLTFAHASWLERIHNNGGRPIYIGTSEPVRTEPFRPAVAGVPPPSSPPPPVLEKAAPLRQPAARDPRPASTKMPFPPPVPAAGSADVAGLLLRAKGLRPLAEMLIREVRAAAPGVTVTAAPAELISFANPREFAVLLTGPKELRLGLHLGDATPDSAASPARIPGTGGHITHMLVVNDARQVGPPLIELIRCADRLANGE